VTHRHPEWKRLMDECGPLAEPGAFFSFEQLSDFAGCDIRTSNGRAQLARFRRELLRSKNVWLQSDRNHGYRVVQPAEHGDAAYGQLSRARRRIRMGKEIVGHTRLEALSDNERKSNADILARLSRIEAAVETTKKGVRKILVAVERKRLPSPVLDKTD
jgi:hypothetical protein